ncbi:AzlD domain-containing protein [Roseospira marina]|uniref:AzlD domain-containing protein n=1 Tax=Roseospira marina TaxID=140057 RepID=A0A5M6IEZ2_9PROT|nr:AzlD domain-containing protein [Roseospira marina]KAA5606702.1 AzlD domain-containing protein [Roseospira marina]MBB4313885.1 branched-subunit amino acid transport protein [Roseospira marina]MBB5087047.1 branched-subunit amino acid transport protein [Roseospira marina]
MSNADTSWFPVVAILVGAVVTYAWRALGTSLSGRLRADSPIMAWSGCVAHALLAALIARMIVLPVGPLETTPMAARLAGVAVGVAVFFGLGRNILIAVIAGAATMAGGVWLVA